MPTNQQLGTIHKAAKVVGLIDGTNDARYRLLLRNVAAVDSARDLDNVGVEDVMAVFEDLGFNGHPAGKTYWRDKVRQRGYLCGERAVHRIQMLAADPAVRYPLYTLCDQVSDGRTDNPTKLKPGEAWKLIEMLKSVIAREGEKDRNDTAGARTAPAT